LIDKEYMPLNEGVHLKETQRAN